MNQLVASGDQELWLTVMGTSYIDKEGYMWADANLVFEDPDRQNVVDYTLYQLFALVPENYHPFAGHLRKTLEVIEFRQYPGEDSANDRYCLYGIYSETDEYGCMYQMPPDLWRFQNLKRLICEKAAFRFLPDSICKCLSLEYFVVRSLHTASLPGHFGELINLKDLKICNSLLVALPESFRCNRFAAVPDGIAEMDSLEELDLGAQSTEGPQQGISQLPGFLGRLKHLKGLTAAIPALSVRKAAGIFRDNRPRLEIRENNPPV